MPPPFRPPIPTRFQSRTWLGHASPEAWRVLGSYFPGPAVFVPGWDRAGSTFASASDLWDPRCSDGSSLPLCLHALRGFFSGRLLDHFLLATPQPPISGTSPFKLPQFREWRKEPMGSWDLGVTSGSSPTVAALVALVCESNRSDPSQLGMCKQIQEIDACRNIHASQRKRCQNSRDSLEDLQTITAELHEK
ncbi:hypothetical protein NDU88_007824 [Pleurodeles waltl]|uniref:Uncharacterized protein n=1 Tax=Pleurodeles waltl TaxID=8319 RepID=A0AAV7QLZ7_PLEWA|nr:hypothetical protein NDU88_007824 [Pleurodeles waltl]